MKILIVLLFLCLCLLTASGKECKNRWKGCESTPRYLRKYYCGASSHMRRLCAKLCKTCVEPKTKKTAKRIVFVIKSYKRTKTTLRSTTTVRPTTQKVTKARRMTTTTTKLVNRKPRVKITTISTTTAKPTTTKTPFNRKTRGKITTTSTTAAKPTTTKKPFGRKTRGKITTTSTISTKPTTQPIYIKRKDPVATSSCGDKKTWCRLVATNTKKYCTLYAAECTQTCEEKCRVQNKSSPVQQCMHFKDGNYKCSERNCRHPDLIKRHRILTRCAKTCCSKGQFYDKQNISIYSSYPI